MEYNPYNMPCKLGDLMEMKCMDCGCDVTEMKDWVRTDGKVVRKKNVGVAINPPLDSLGKPLFKEIVKCIACTKKNGNGRNKRKRTTRKSRLYVPIKEVNFGPLPSENMVGKNIIHRPESWPHNPNKPLTHFSR